MKYRLSTLLGTLAALSLSVHSSMALASAELTHLKLEVRGHHRSSEDLSLQAPFPPDTFQRTVDPGDSSEISRITLFSKVQFSESWLMLSKLDLVDLYERNPTTSDREIDIDTLIFRYGTKHTHGLLPEETSYYAQIGKFGKFERQEDRHLESYGLISTAFNRLEDTGLEFGVDLPQGFYGKLSYTTGTPLFFRDPNALAGDNGVEFASDPEDPDHNSGMLILYDAEVEDFDLSENPETSVGLGYRWLNDEGSTRINALIHHNERELADTIELEGTGYGGDLDLLQVVPSELPPDTISAPVGFVLDGDKKTESGLTLWLYHQNFAMFSQYVTQDIAGQERDGWETELSYLYEFDDMAYLQSLTPVLRYSSLSPDYTIEGPFPAMSVTWEWDKIDVGFDYKVNKYFNLLVEHSINEFERAGKTEDYDETLVTLLFKFDLNEEWLKKNQ